MNKPLLLLLTVIPVLAWAERGDPPVRTSGWYVGAALGVADVEIKTSLGSIDDFDSGYKLFSGYRWWNPPLPWDLDLGFEVSWVDLGEREEELNDGYIWKMSNEGYAADLRGFLPLGRNWELTGKAGLFFADTRLSNVEIAIDSGNDDSTELTLGIGIGYQGARGFGARAEIESFGVMDGGYLWSLSATYQFK